MGVVDSEEYVERVLSLVEQVPPGRVTTYGVLAEAVGVGGPRQVGRVMSTYGGSIAWWRVVRADGTLSAHHGTEARERYREESTPLRASGSVNMSAALWWPTASAASTASPPGTPPCADESVGGV